jgi:hypothetical protein
MKSRFCSFFCSAVLVFGVSGCGSGNVAPAPAKLAAPSPEAAKDKKSAPALLSREALLNIARDQGYKPTASEGNTVWCRRFTPIGSRLEKTECLSEDQVVQVIRNEQEARDYMKRPAACGGPNCGGG